MKKIIFHSNQLSLRGTEIALYDYAFHNENYLGNKSVIAYPNTATTNDVNVIKKFSDSFEVHPYERISGFKEVIKKTQADMIYAIKAGHNDGFLDFDIPLMVHAVFPQKIKEVHGQSYAFVSEWLSYYCSNGKVPFVPHMVALPKLSDNLRQKLHIPDDSVVFGSYGGADSFDLDFVKKAIIDVLNIRKDMYFIFMNMKSFCNHDRVIFLPASSNNEDKVRFINTTNAMIHARKLGESFGLACAEFSILNKPIITYKKSKQRNHLLALGDAAILYGNYNDVLNIFSKFSVEHVIDKDFDRYSREFSPHVIMDSFKKNLIEPALMNDKMKVDFSLYDRFLCRLEKLKVKIGAL